MLHITREASTYREEEGTEGSYGKSCGEKGVGFDGSENESNLTGMKEV